jgi:hypothetical protein
MIIKQEKSPSISSYFLLFAEALRTMHLANEGQNKRFFLLAAGLPL